MPDRTYHLTSLVLSIAIGVLLFVSAVFVYTSYVSTQKAIEREISRSFEYRNRTAELSLSNILRDTRHAITDTVEIFSNSERNAQDGLFELARQLDELLLNPDGRYIDLLAVVKTDQTMVFDLTNPLMLEGASLLRGYLKPGQIPDQWKLALSQKNNRLYAALVNSIPVVNADLGEVIAYVVYGISLSDNVSIADAMQRSAEASLIEIHIQDQVLASSSNSRTVQNLKTLLAQSKRTAYQDDGQTLAIRTYIESTVKQELDSAYKTNLLIFLLVSVLAAVVALLLIRRITTTGFGHLIKYASEVSKSEQAASYTPGGIAEFNTLGHALEEMLSSVQASNVALQKSEAQLRSLIETIPDLVWLKDPEGVYLACNPKFELYLGKPESEIVGKTDFDFLDRTTAESIRSKDIAAICTGEPTVAEETFTYADTGQSELVETIKTPMLSSDGKLLGLLGVGRNITERHQSEIALRRSQKMDAVGQLTGGIAHDFNNIMGIILGNLDLLDIQPPKEEKVQSRLAKIRKAATRASSLTKQLLGFSRRQPAQLSAVNINQLINGMDNLIIRSVTPEVEVETALENNLWDTEIDPGDFEDSLINLIINARDAMSGSGHLMLETKNCTLDESYCSEHPRVEPGDYVQISVTDTGAGIPQELQDRIFEPFFTTKPQGKGTGLGLAMVFGFAQRSGGHISIYSELGVGTTIRIYLSRLKGMKRVHEQRPAVKEVAPSGNETILVVDDESGLRDLANEFLTDLGYRVVTAIDGQSALVQLKQEPGVDLLFSDIVMPGGMDGYQLAEQAQKFNPSLKILLTSGYAERALLRNGETSFRGNVLVKPYNRNELARKIREILDTHSGTA